VLLIFSKNRKEIFMLTLVKAIMAGIAISIAGVVYLSVENKNLGAFLFSIGLFTIYTFSLNLYTGKICYIPNKSAKYLLEVFLVYAGNAIGTVFFGYLARFTKLSKLVPKAQELALNKLSDTYFSAFLMAICCGILMCVAVLGFSKINDGVGKYLALTLPVAVFILAGFEHSIANLFYFSFAGVWDLKALAYSLIYAAGNLVGGIILPFIVLMDENKTIKIKLKAEKKVKALKI